MLDLREWTLFHERRMCDLEKKKNLFLHLKETDIFLEKRSNILGETTSYIATLKIPCIYVVTMKHKVNYSKYMNRWKRLRFCAYKIISISILGQFIYLFFLI